MISTWNRKEYIPSCSISNRVILKVVLCLLYGDRTHWNRSRHLVFWWSSFLSNGNVNNTNACYWGSKKPNLYLHKPLHGKKSNCLGCYEFNSGNCAFFASKMMKLWHLTVPVILKEELIQRKSGFHKMIWRYKPPVTDWLHHTFNGHFISFETANVWHSPDLSPLDFFLWWHLKDLVCKPQQTLQ